ncbi:MAG: META domain-containing protein [Bacteroidales bacterium]|nr:META domain-containing protein [Bacteroidales bacterium]
MKKIILIPLLLLLSLGNVFSGSPKRAAGRTDGAWQIVELQGHSVEAGENIPYINLNCLKKAMNGFAGCNYIHGTFRINTVKRHLQFGSVASTRMACPQMQLESKVLELLPLTASYHIESPEEGSDLLVLHAQDGSDLMKLSRMMPLDGKWTVSKVEEVEIPEQENEIFLVFNSSQKMVYGNLGCNSYNASLEYTPQQKSLLKLGTGMTTLRLCEQMELEKQLLQAFQNVVSYKKFSDRKAILCDKSGKVLIELAR